MKSFLGGSRGKSEEMLGNAGVAQRYTVDTKHMGGFQPGYAKKENVIADAENSKKKLGCNVKELCEVNTLRGVYGPLQPCSRLRKETYLLLPLDPKIEREPQTEDALSTNTLTTR